MTEMATVRGLTGKIKVTPEQRGQLAEAKSILSFQEKVIDNLAKAGRDVSALQDKIKYTRAALSETERFIE